MLDLLSILRGERCVPRLDWAALELATIEYPGLDAGVYVAMLDDHAAALAPRVPPDAPLRDFVAAANEYLFHELGFTGNEEDYYDPRNSCLNDVLVRRTGIPITLSVVYMEVARRLGRDVVGVGLPGHFIVQAHGAGEAIYLDPFHGGRALTPAQCFALARKASGAEIPEDASLLEPASPRQIIERMIHNLRATYFHRGNYAKAVEAVNLLVSADPRSAEPYKHRGVLYARLRNARAAVADLSKYLELAPEAPDAGQMRKQVRVLRQYLAALN